MRFANKTLLAVPMIALGLLTGCKKSDSNTSGSEETVVDFTQMSVPEKFGYETTESKTLDLQVNLLGGQPYSGARFDVVLENPEQALDNDSLRNALTVVQGIKLDDNGNFNAEIKLPAYVDTLYLLSKSIGIPPYFAIAKKASGYSYKFDGSVEAAKAQTVAALKGKSSGMNVLARSWDYKGFPDYLIDPIEVSARFLRRFQAAVPFKTPVNPALLSADIPRDITLNLKSNQTAQVSITFMFATSAYKNVLGYYWYPTNNPPATKNNIPAGNKGYIFPSTQRSSIVGNSGLQAGHTIKLVGPNADGSFPPNTSIGFFLISNGFANNATTSSPGTINTNRTTYWSKKEWNAAGSGNMAGITQRMVTLYDAATNKIVWAFEDGVDADFSDAAFFASWTPDEAIDKTKYPPTPDVPKTDADYVFYPGKNTKGTLLFEDCWPRLADFDMNDMVLNYNYVGALGEDNKVSEVSFVYDLTSVSASQNNSFAVSIPDIDPNNVASVTNKNLSGVNLNTTQSRTFAIESGHTNDVVVKVFDNAGTLLGGEVVNNTGGIENKAAETFCFTVKFKNGIPVSAFNKISPFIIPRGKRYLETHLANQRPTVLASKQYFQTEDDNSSDAASRYYLSNSLHSLGNITWGVDIPEKIPYPKSGKSMAGAYKKFSSWATSGGALNKDWYKGGFTNRDGGSLYYGNSN